MCNPTQCRYLVQTAHLVVSLDRTAKLRGVDPFSIKALGYEAPAVAGKAFADFVAPDQQPHLARILERCGTDQPVWDELTLVAADGRRIPMLCCFQRLREPGEKGNLLVTGMRLDAFQSAGRLDAAAVLGQLAFRCHGPAHRLMQAIEAVLMQEPWSGAAMCCRTELDALLEVMSQSIASPQADGAPGNGGADKSADVVRVLESALRLVDSDPEFKGLEVTLRPEAASIRAAADPVGLVFVALRLARNARDATHGAKSPRLMVDVYQADGHVVVEFKDNGSGEAEQNLGGAGSPFFRKSDRVADSADLGLMTCTELVEYMGGKIRVRSTPAKGTTVFVNLPSAQQ